MPTTDGKRKVRPDRRGVDAYGQPVQAVPSPAGGSPHEEAQGAETFENAAQVRGEGGPKTEASWLKRLGGGIHFVYIALKKEGGYPWVLYPRTSQLYLLTKSCG